MNRVQEVGLEILEQRDSMRGTKGNLKEKCVEVDGSPLF